jgi:hypothetical protein
MTDTPSLTILLHVTPGAEDALLANGRIARALRAAHEAERRPGDEDVFAPPMSLPSSSSFSSYSLEEDEMDEDEDFVPTATMETDDGTRPLAQSPPPPSSAATLILDLWWRPEEAADRCADVAKLRARLQYAGALQALIDFIDWSMAHDRTSQIALLTHSYAVNRDNPVILYSASS